MPKRNRTTTSEAKFQAIPVAAVKADHQRTMRVRILRGPKTSPIQPVGISKAAYAKVNALKAQPSVAGLRCSSSRIGPAAAPIATRSRNVMSERRNVKTSSVRLPRRSDESGMDWDVTPFDPARRQGRRDGTVRYGYSASDCPAGRSEVASASGEISCV